MNMTLLSDTMTFSIERVFLLFYDSRDVIHR